MSHLVYGLLLLMLPPGWCGDGHVRNAQVVSSGEPITLAYSGAAVALAMADLENGDDQNDPGFRLYREGYHFVLSEKWVDARKKFVEFIKKYPKSEYLDDAHYWSAYALKHIDRKKAVNDYISFITKFPNSRYYDDAVADLTEISKGHPVTIGKYIDDEGTRVYVSGEGRGISVDSAGAVIRDHADSIVIDKHGRPVARSGKRIDFNFGSTPRPMVIHEKSLEALSRALGRMRMPPVISPFSPFGPDEHLDKATRLKIEALQALGESNDSGAFTALKKVALDGSNACQLRVAAMQELANIQVADPLPVFVDIAKRDTNEEIQNFAIDQIGMLSADKNRSVETLIQLFDAIPNKREDRRAEIFFSIAEVGNDKAVEFLSRVAKNDENYDLRSQAIYYLGSIGTPKARAALLEILQK